MPGAVVCYSRAMNLKQKISAILSQASGPIYTSKNGRRQSDSEHLRMLKVLYAQTSPKLQRGFSKHVLKYLTERNAKHVCHAILDFEDVKYLKHILETATTSTSIVAEVLNAVEERLRTEPFKFNETDLDDLEGTLRYVGTVKYKHGYNMRGEALLYADALNILYRISRDIKHGIQRARYVHVKKELLEGPNPEINTDKEALVSRMVALGFRGSIADALEEVEKKLANAISPFDFKGVMDLVRTIYEEAFEDAANSVANRRKKIIPEGTHFARFKTFLISENLLTGEEAKLSQELYNYLSNQGSHVLSSAPEQARLTKNIVIEVCLLVIGRVETSK